MQKVLSERIAELDILRALAIFAVILIHSLSGALYGASWSSGTFKFYLLLDQFCRFSVPLFVGLSGYTLTLKYKDNLINIGEFFRRRVLRLIPWYLFWSALIFSYIRFSVFWIGAPHFPFWKVIFLGKADYHLYFVPMILQLYVLFPFLIFLLKKWGKWFLALIFLMEMFFYFVLGEFAVGRITLPFLLNDQQQYIFSGTWIFYFVLGIYLALDSQLVNFAKKYKFPFLAILFLAFCWEVFNTFNLTYSFHDLTLATRSTRIPVLIYATFFYLTITAVMDYFNVLPRKLYRLLVGIGQRSYVIYLLHTIPLRVFSSYIRPSSALSMLLLFVIVALTSDYMAQISLSAARYAHAKFLIRRVEEI
jgi:surface polysaccharide O-acyltransferase-like enzyme